MQFEIVGPQVQRLPVSSPRSDHLLSLGDAGRLQVVFPSSMIVSSIPRPGHPDANCRQPPINGPVAVFASPHVIYALRAPLAPSLRLFSAMASNATERRNVYFTFSCTLSDLWLASVRAVITHSARWFAEVAYTARISVRTSSAPRSKQIDCNKRSQFPKENHDRFST